MSFFDDASLVMIPSGYKDQKIYSVKPTDGSGDLTFSRASTATRVNSSGLVEAVASGVPRLDYLNSTCPKLLLEPQRTNLVLYSEQLDNATWTAQNGTVTANTTVSPDGTQNADTFTSDSTTGEHNAYTTIPLTILSSAFTTSCYVKPLTGRYFSLSNYQAGQNYSAYATFDLQTGTTVATGAPFGTYISNSIQSVGNGWYRVSVTGSGVTSNFVGLNAMTAANFNPSVSTLGQGQSYAIYGVQLEQGAYATSYIPTTIAAVTRVAESAVKASVTSLIGQTEGTIFMDAVIDAFPTDNSFFGVEKTASSFVIRFGSGGSNVYAQVYNGTTNLFFEPTAYTLGTRVKLAFAYKAGSYAFYKNGTLVGTGTNATTIPACDSIMTNSLWGNTGNGKHGISQAILFKTRLTNAQLAELTA
jgi:hypothetical protein